MIISTNKSDMMLRRAFQGDRNKTSIIAIDKLIEQLSIDPTITDPVRECYVVTNEDISGASIKAKFEQAVAVKHPKARVILINKSSKPLYPQGLPGVDAILQKPRPQDINQAIGTITAGAETTISTVIEQQVEDEPIPEYVPEAPKPTSFGFDESMLGTEEEPVSEELPNVPVVEEPAPEPVVTKSVETLEDRVAQAGSVADISVLMREISASTLIKEIVATNSTYAGIEENLKSLNDNIFVIMNDSTISLDAKLEKVRALLHDKNFYAAKGDTIIEQRLQEVIDAICRRTSELLTSRLDEIETAIRKSVTQKDFDINSARLSGLNEERANLSTELMTLQVELDDIFKGSDKLVVDTATSIGEKAMSPTGNEMLDTHLKAQGTIIASNETVSAIRSALDIASSELPTNAKELKLKVVRMRKLLSDIFDMDAEIIAAQQTQINWLKAHNVEDTVVAQNLLKKSLRVYVGADGSGRSTIAYLISRYKSRQNANVLCIDLTGTTTYDNYGIGYKSLDTYMVERNQEEFLLVSGKIENTPEAAQSIVTTLLRAADYYRVINVVLTPEQRELFHTIAQDVLSVNYVVNTDIDSLSKMKEVIADTHVENVGQRVIFNKCDVQVRPLVKRLGLDERIDFQICTIPTIPAVTDACINGYNPYGVSAVDLIMEEVVKHA